VKDYFTLPFDGIGDKRRHPRALMFSPAILHFEGLSSEVIVSNISLSGLCFHSRKRLEIGKAALLEVERKRRSGIIAERVQGTIVAAHGGGIIFSYGMQFSETLSFEKQPFLYLYIDTVQNGRP
jgi:hypothetical protein